MRRDFLFYQTSYNQQAAKQRCDGSPTTSERMRATTEGQSSYPGARRGVRLALNHAGIEDVR